MTTTTKTTCDNCQAEIPRTEPPHLTLEVAPPFSRFGEDLELRTQLGPGGKHFCDLKCVHAWLTQALRA